MDGSVSVAFDRCTFTNNTQAVPVMELYFNIVSPPCQSVLLVGKKLGITFDLKEVNPHLPEVREQLKKYNPQHTIPTFIEDGHVIWESYAIVIYLVEKYGKDDSLYPKDAKVRSIVNQRLFFDNGVMYKAAIQYVECILKKKLEPTDEMVQKLKKALELLESFVKDGSFVAADHLTIADICLLSSVTMLAGIKYDLEPYPAIQAWVARVTGELPNYAEFHKELLEKSMDLVSPPCQSAILVAKKLGITLNLKKTNIHDPVERDALTKLNPQHTIPTLVDNGHVVWESYAIVTYLVEAYAKDDTLYPKDPKVRSVVNQRLFFDIGTLYKQLIDVIHLVVKKEQPTDEQMEKLKKSIALLEHFVTERSYAAADHMTVADICLLSTVTALNWLKYDLEPFPHIRAWVARVTAEIPDYAEFRKDADEATKAQSAILVAKKLGITLNLRNTNIYDPVELNALSKINPYHMLPMLVDGESIIFESYAIIIYLVETYGKDDTLYPSDPKVRAVVNQRLFFDVATLYKQIYENIHVKMQHQKPTEKQEQRLKKATDILEHFLAERSYAAANHLTVADICLVITVTALTLWLGYDLEPYPRIRGWYERATAEIPDWAQFRKECEEATRAYVVSRNIVIRP
uniref:glutathione transferase n=1 Tax=Anopheles culicifacies TaxID=139723 RepID=A0A182MHB0_9DIPT